MKKALIWTGQMLLLVAVMLLIASVDWWVNLL